MRKHQPSHRLRISSSRLHNLEHAHKKDFSMAPNLDDLIEWLLNEVVSTGEDGQSTFSSQSSALQDVACGTRKCIWSPVKV